MSIKFNSEKKIFKLDTSESSYVFGITDHGVPVHYYYGAAVGDDDLAYLSTRWGHSGVQAKPHYAGTSIFHLGTQPLEYSTFGTGDYRPTALRVKSPSGQGATDLAYVSHKIYKGKPDVEGMPETHAAEDEAETLELLLTDSFTGLYVTLFYTVFENLSVMTRHAVVENRSDKPLNIESVYSTCLDLQGDFDFIHLWGRPCFERNYERTPVGHTVTTVQSLRGASSHFHNPFVALASPDTTEDFGEVYGFNLVYSGNFAASAYKDPFDGVRFVMGINHEGFNWLLEAGEHFTAPEVVMVYSDKGLGHMSRTFHKLYQNHLCKSEWMTKKRPILINNWEGTYFKFDADKLCAIAEKAAGLGVELFVLDDGWFGKRNDDRAGLGDYAVNLEKLPHGIDGLAEKINKMGMQFGLWFEPESVNPDSDLYRAHPDWALTDGFPNLLGRHQLLLDLTKPEVRDYIVENVTRVLDSAPISYVKWDMNRHSIALGKKAHDYILGLYEVLRRIFSPRPEILLENCASGGNRFDLGVLCFGPQTWCSDDTDAVERAEIQYGTSLIYPMSCQSAHVSVCPNHQTGRTTSMAARHIFALTGSFGYELAPEKINETDREYVKEFIKFYNENFDIFQNGKYYRITNPKTDDYAVFEYVLDNKVIVGLMRLSTHAVNIQTNVKLCGLDENKIYTDKATKQTYYGSQLMNYGLKIMTDGKNNDFYAMMWEFE